MLDLFVEYHGVEFPVISTILDKLSSDSPFSLHDLEQISVLASVKETEAAAEDFQMILELNSYRNMFPAPPTQQACVYTHQQFVMPAERFEPKVPDENATEYEILEYFSSKVIQSIVLGLRARGERLMLARNIIADMEEQSMM